MSKHDDAARAMTPAERDAMRRKLMGSAQIKIDAISEVELEKYLARAGASANRAGFLQHMAKCFEKDPMRFLGPYADEAWNTGNFVSAERIAEAVALFDAHPDCKRVSDLAAKGLIKLDERDREIFRSADDRQWAFVNTDRATLAGAGT